MFWNSEVFLFLVEKKTKKQKNNVNEQKKKEKKTKHICNGKFLKKSLY